MTPSSRECDGQTLEVIYTWPDGREEVRYRATAGTEKADELQAQVDHLKSLHGPESPYSSRVVGTADQPVASAEAPPNCRRCGQPMTKIGDEWECHSTQLALSDTTLPPDLVATQIDSAAQEWASVPQWLKGGDWQPPSDDVTNETLRWWVGSHAKHTEIGRMVRELARRRAQPMPSEALTEADRAACSAGAEAVRYFQSKFPSARAHETVERLERLAKSEQVKGEV